MYQMGKPAEGLAQRAPAGPRGQLAVQAGEPGAPLRSLLLLPSAARRSRGGQGSLSPLQPLTPKSFSVLAKHCPAQRGAEREAVPARWKGRRLRGAARGRALTGRDSRRVGAAAGPRPGQGITSQASRGWKGQESSSGFQPRTQAGSFSFPAPPL